MTDTRRNEADRERLLDKLRKLLALGQDPRTSAHEAEAAMRQAGKLMAQHDIDESEVTLAKLAGGTLDLGEEVRHPFGGSARPSNAARRLPTWIGLLAAGVGRFTEARVVHKRDDSLGAVLVFQGYKPDVALATWMFELLVRTTVQAQRASPFGGRSDATAFLNGAAAVLQGRLYEAAAARRQACAEQASGGRDGASRALVVVDRKAALIAERFGKTRAKRVGLKQTPAFDAGTAVGAVMALPTSRPLEADQPRARLDN